MTLDLQQAASWRWVPGYTGRYEVSDAGEVRCVSRYRRGGKLYVLPAPQPLKPVPGNNGYLRIGLSDRDSFRIKLVHRLVLEAFVGPCPTGHLACHLNGNRGDNRLANLKWGTQTENQFHRRAHGTHLEGEEATNAKLKEHDVLEIRKLRAAGWELLAIAQKFGVTKANVSQICKGISWKHLA